jgi:hypothetical protein
MGKPRATGLPVAVASSQAPGVGARRYPGAVRQRDLETIGRRGSSDDLPGATLGATGWAGHRSTREPLRSVAGSRAHDRNGRVTLPHPGSPGRR